MPRPVHFDIAADDPDRAMKFYKAVFGWKFNKWDGPLDYWLVTTGEKDEPGINGGISRRNKQMPGVMNTIGVQSVDRYMKKIETKGGKILMPKMAIPGIGWFATCQDTEGNVFGIIQEDAKAK
jgi:hypothetical protein